MSARKSVKLIGFPSTSPAKTYQAGVKSRRKTAVMAIRGVPTGALADTIRAARSGLYGSLTEIKFFDCRPVIPVTTNPYGLPSLPIGNDPTFAFTGITCLNLVRQGATAYNRTGAKILIKSVDFKCLINIGGNAPAPIGVRICLIYDRQPNGAYASFVDMFSDNISTNPDFLANLNMANKDRFSVLRNTIYTLDLYQQTYAVKEHCKCRLDTMFKADAGNIGDISTGALYLVAYASSSAVANWATITNIHSRIRYYD